MRKLFQQLRKNLFYSLRRRSLNDSVRSAFTLVEMVIAITVFTIFIGFVMAAYLTFHKAQQEAAITRSLIMESEATLDLLTDSLQTYMIDYERYADEDPSNGDLQFAFAERAFFNRLDSSDSLITDTLYLISVDGSRLAYVWDDEEEQLFMEMEDASEGDGVETNDFESVLLHAEGVSASFVSFEIFPDVNPYDSENISDDDLQFQPIVQLKLTFSAPGRVREEISVDFQTSVTSRFYQ